MIAQDRTLMLYKDLIYRLLGRMFYIEHGDHNMSIKSSPTDLEGSCIDLIRSGPVSGCHCIII